MRHGGDDVLRQLRQLRLILATRQQYLEFITALTPDQAPVAYDPLQSLAHLPQQCVTVEQTERLGTGHAVMMAKEFIREHPGDVVVLNGDAPFVSDQVIGSALERHAHSMSAQ